MTAGPSACSCMAKACLSSKKHPASSAHTGPWCRCLLLVAGGAGTLRLVALDGGAGRPRELLPLRATPLALAVHAASQTLAVLCAPEASPSDPQAGGVSEPGCGGTPSSSGGEGGDAASERDTGSWMDEEDSGAGAGRSGATGDSGDELDGPAGQHRNGGMMSSPEREQGSGGDERPGGRAGGGGGAQGEAAGGRGALHELRCIDPATGVAGHVHTQQAGCQRKKH